MFNFIKESCPYQNWTSVARELCPNPDHFHCLKDEYGRIGWVCTDPIWVEKDRCPVFNLGAQKLDTTPCFQTKCPPYNYRSNDIDVEHVCRYIMDRERLSTSSVSSTTMSPAPAETVKTIQIILVLIITTVLLALVGIVVAFICRGNLKKQKPGNTVVEQGESRNLLQITNLSENKIEKQARSFKVAKDILSVKRTIVITGVQGSGKTFLAKSLVSDLQRNGHVLKSTWISDFRQLREEKMTPITNEIFIFDEVFYELQINEKFKETLKTLKKFVTENEKPYVIVTIPSYNWEKNFEEFKVNFDWMHINLDERDKMEKRAILHSLLKRSDLPGEQANIIGNLESHLLKADSNSIGFPALISWICKQSSEESVEKLLKTPLKSISDKIDSLKNSLKVEESGKYLILAYMSLKDGKMNVDNVDTKLLDSLKESYVPGFVKDDLKKYAEDMVGYYLTRNEDGCYEFDSNIMKKIVLVSLAKQCTLFVKLNYENECLKHIIPKQLCPNDIGTIYAECFTTI